MLAADFQTFQAQAMSR